MPLPTMSEIYLVSGLMALFLVVSGVSIYLFIRQYRREKGGKGKDENGDK